MENLIVFLGIVEISVVIIVGLLFVFLSNQKPYADYSDKENDIGYSDEEDDVNYSNMKNDVGYSDVGYKKADDFGYEKENNVGYEKENDFGYIKNKENIKKIIPTINIPTIPKTPKLTGWKLKIYNWRLKVDHWRFKIDHKEEKCKDLLYEYHDYIDNEGNIRKNCSSELAGKYDWRRIK